MKENFNNVIARLGPAYYELLAYIKQGGLSNEQLKSRYNVTAWFLTRLRKSLDYQPTTTMDRDRNIINDICRGLSDFEIMNKYHIKSSELSLIKNSALDNQHNISNKTTTALW